MSGRDNKDTRRLRDNFPAVPGDRRRCAKVAGKLHKCHRTVPSGAEVQPTFDQIRLMFPKGGPNVANDDHHFLLDGLAVEVHCVRAHGS